MLALFQLQLCLLRQVKSMHVQVGIRWSDFTAQEHTQLASTVFSLLRQGEPTSRPVPSKPHYPTASLMQLQQSC